MQRSLEQLKQDLKFHTEQAEFLQKQVAEEEKKQKDQFPTKAGAYLATFSGTASGIKELILIPDKGDPVSIDKWGTTSKINETNPSVGLSPRSYSNFEKLNAPDLLALVNDSTKVRRF